MSSQTGIYYFDLRPVSHDVEAALHDALGTLDTDARGDYSSSGLMMAHAATWIDPLAASERQPYTSPSGHTITFDGRLDNREDLLLRLRSQLHGQPTDAALALAAYVAWGVDGFVHLVGDWSVAIWERDTRSLVLASDYAGGRPLYYHNNGERVIWSSHLKPLVTLAEAHELDDQFIAGFLMGHGAPARTPYRGVVPVPGGHALRFGTGGSDTRRFWRLPVHNRIRYETDREYDEQLRALFRESVRARLRTSFPVCSELSGGLDSSSIVCMASSLIADRAAEAPRLECMSFGPPGAPDEKFYTAVQRFCGVEGVTVNTDDFPFLHLDLLQEAQPAPWAALFGEVARRVDRLGARVYLTGQGGDLLMGNFVDDSEQIAGHLRRGRINTAFTEAVAWSKATRVPAPALLWNGLLAALPGQWGFGSRYSTPATGTVRERYGDSLTAQFKSSTGVAEPDWMWSTLWKQAPPERRKHFLNLSRVLESGVFRPPESLQHLYYTHPYFHRPLVEFLMAIPANILCQPGKPRILMRRAFQALLPPEVGRRRSKASYTGVFLESVRPAARAILADTGRLRVVERGYVDAASVRSRLERITQSLNCNEPQLRQIVLLEFWLRARDKAMPGMVGSATHFALAASF